MVSTAAPSRTMRPRRSSAFTANGRMVSSLPVCSGSRTGMARSGLVIAAEYREVGLICDPLGSLPIQRPIDQPRELLLRGVEVLERWFALCVGLIGKSVPLYLALDITCPHRP